MSRFSYYVLFLVVVTFILFQVRIVNADKTIKVSEKQAKQLVLQMRENVKRLMEKNAELYNKYDIGSNCFVANDEGYVTLLAFDKEKAFQPRSDYEKYLLAELLSEDYQEEKIEGVSEREALFYCISALKPSNDNCYNCHEVSDCDNKFEAFGAISIAIPVK